jgi:ribosomal protein S18 acetylase RimI-like enzyme
MMKIRTMVPARDLPAVISLWNRSVQVGETLYVPLSEAYFADKFIGNPNYSPELSLVAETGGQVVGFLNGACKKVFLPKETAQNTPGYLTCVIVHPAFRQRDVGSLLLEALCDKMKDAGKTRAACSSGNPIKLDWLIPDTPGHCHNNSPGMDMESRGYGFLLKRGFEEMSREVAMYLNLAHYQTPENLAQRRKKLLEEGIDTGRYDVSLGYDFNGMCDRVGNESWRKVLRDETSNPNPRPFLAATYHRSIVAFTGLVDRQPGGRGGFVGICTDPLFEKKGIATVLFNLLMREYVQIGAQFCTLSTGDTNHAQRVYRKAGFRIVRRFAAMQRNLC